MSDKTEQLILEIQKHPILYDKSRMDFKDTAKKQDVWIQIAQQVGMNEKDAENRWRNVKDALVKYRRKLRTGKEGGPQNVKEYKYEKILTFLLPFQYNRQTTRSSLNSDVKTQATEQEDDWHLSDNRDDDDDNIELESSPPSPVAPPPLSYARSSTSASSTSVSDVNLRRRNDRKRCREEVGNTLCEYLNTETGTPLKKATTAVNVHEKLPDDLDLFMQSMAATVRRLPGHKCAKVKMEIHNIIHKAEIEHLYPPTKPKQMFSTAVNHQTSSFQSKPLSENSRNSVASAYDENVRQFNPGAEDNRPIPPKSGIDYSDNYNM